MPFSVSTWPLRAYQSSPSSRRILKTVAIGLDYLKDSKILKLFFGIEGSLWFKSVPSRSTWLNSTPVCGWTTAGQVGAGGLYGMNTTALYPPVGGGYMIWKEKKKIQICQMLLFHLSQEEHWLSPERKQTVWLSGFRQPNTRFGEFFGTTGLCRIWISNFSVLSKTTLWGYKEKSKTLCYGNKDSRRLLKRSGSSHQCAWS